MIHEDTNLNLLYLKVVGCINDTREKLSIAANKSLLETYYYIGKSIQECIINKDFSINDYKELSSKLTKVYNSGFSVNSLQLMVEFSKTFNNIEEINFKINWPKYVLILRYGNIALRKSLIYDCEEFNYSINELKKVLKR